MMHVQHLLILSFTGAVLTLLVACGEPGGNAESRRGEIDAAATRIYAGVPPAGETAELIERGGKLFRTGGCESCHSTRIDRMGLVGPPLGRVSDRVLDRHDNDALEARRWLVRHIKAPQLYPSPYLEDEAYTGAHMPPYNHFRDEDMRALVEFLWSLK
jgi:cytochrome c551/c552